ncbi:MAG TPA: hypothetical protein VFZ66_26260 [Herpetosiphonaceae bacterium]
MTKLRLILASTLILVGLAACTSGPTPGPATTTPPEASAPSVPTSTPIPESAYPSPGYPSPSSSP